MLKWAPFQEFVLEFKLAGILTSTYAYKRNGLGPENLSDLFIRNSESHLRALRNTSTDLQLSKTNDKQRAEMLFV